MISTRSQCACLQDKNHTKLLILRRANSFYCVDIILCVMLNGKFSRFTSCVSRSVELAWVYVQ